MNTSDIHLSAAEVADLTSLTTGEIQNLHPDDFGVPGHWYLNKHSTVVYTEQGIDGLVNALAAERLDEPAVKLKARLVELRAERETPSRALIAPGPKSTEAAPFAWQGRADCQ
jgi:hypothetical protein